MLAALAPGAIWAQMSTIGVGGIGRVAALASADRPDVMLLDAPVSGSKDPAERGELTIFAPGPGEARSRVAPLFGALGQRTIWVGDTGSGTRLKLVNNTWLAFANEALAASVALAHRLGLATGTVVDALGGAPLVSPWQAAKLQRIADGEFSPRNSRCRSRSRTYTWPSRRPVTAGWRSLPAWLTNGSGPLTRGSVSRT
jgi:3-hydroxyisobutyrate dehydrogenase